MESDPILDEMPDPKPETAEEETTVATDESSVAGNVNSNVQQNPKTSNLGTAEPSRSRAPPAGASRTANTMGDGSANSLGRSSRRRQVEDETPLMSQTELNSFLNEVEKQRAYLPSSALPQRQIEKQDQGEAESGQEFCNASADESSAKPPGFISPENRYNDGPETTTTATLGAEDTTGHTSEDSRAKAIESKVGKGQHPQLGAYAIGGVNSSPNNEQDSASADAATAAAGGGDGSVVMHEGQNHVLLEATLVVEEEEPADLEDGASNRKSAKSGQLGSTDSSQDDENNNHQASLIVEAKPLEFLLTRKKLFFGVLLTVLAFVALITGFMVTRNKSSKETIPPILQQVAERGVLRCGVNDITKARSELIFGQPEFMPETICQIIASAILGPDYAFELFSASLPQGYDLLKNSTFDVLIPTPEGIGPKDIYEGQSGLDFSYSVPYFYDGLMFSGNSYDSVQCVEDGMNGTWREECQQATICIPESSPYRDMISQHIPGVSFVLFDTYLDQILGFMGGQCDVMASTGIALSEDGGIRVLGYVGPYVRGHTVYSKETYALVTPKADRQWSNFVNGIIYTLLAAEQRNLTKDRAIEIGETGMFGEKYKKSFIHAISHKGNYGQSVYDEFQELNLPRNWTGWNFINTGESGLITPSLPFEMSLVEGSNPEAGAMLEMISERGNLKCAIPSGPAYLVDGIDKDFCEALAASIFGGDASKVIKVEVADEAAGFGLLASGEADVMAGAMWTYGKSVQEESTGFGYSFTQPYFYGSTGQENRCLATRQDDSQWSVFVLWVLMSTIQAENQGITMSTSSSMPDMHIFGPSYSNMFRHAVSAVGNYAEIYARSVAESIPRDGRNALATLQNPGPLHFVPPDMMP